MSTRNRSVALRWTGMVVGLALVASALAVGGWMLTRSLFDSQWNLTLADLMANESDAPDTTTEVVEITSSACTADIPCVEAYDTAEATYYRFATRDAAEAFAVTVDDGFRSNYIVMDFAGKDAASKTAQLWAMQHLAGTWQDYTGPFPDR